MKFRILTAAAAIPAIATIAYAQTTPSPSPTPPSATTSPETNTTAPQATTDATTSATSPQWYHRQEGEWRSSKLIGAKVENNAGDTVGDINDVILAKDGTASAVVIGVGGVLGVGEREVAVQFKSLQLSRDKNGNAIAKIDTTKEDLKKAPQWTWQSS